MAQNLSKENDVWIVSFSLQYPNFLYKKQQKDFENDSFKFTNTKFLLNTVNPFSYFKTAHFINQAKPDLIIFQWWHPFFAPAFWATLKLIGKKTKAIFLCHNVLPHEKFPLQKFLIRSVLKNANAYIVHSEQDEKDLINFIQNPLCKRAVHPTYSMFKKKGLSCKEARDRLGLSQDTKIILFFGFIREYKGLKHLIRILPDIVAKISSCKLLIAGEFFDNNQAEYFDLITSLHCENSIQLYNGYIADNEVENYFAACDVVVLPYESATQSGIAQIAYGFEKPVIATNVGGLPEVVLNGKTGYIVPPLDEKKLAETIIHFFEMDNAEKFIQNIRAQEDKYSWDRMNEVVHELYDNLNTSEGR